MSLDNILIALNLITYTIYIMPNIKSEFLKTISERGFIHQCTDMDVLDSNANTQMLTAYVGYDATADSLHIGNLVSIMMLYWMQKTGHQPIVLMGGGTTRIGDPSGKDKTRKILSDSEIEKNTKNIENILKTYLMRLYQ